jgi:divalent metal cation (Fe/Co/Zn/Cd) transporter
MMEQFVSKLDDLSKTPIDVKVETNQDLVVKEISVLAKKLEANISDIKKNLNQKVSIDIEELKPLLEKKDWIFDVKRNSEGFIETVIAR